MTNYIQKMNPKTRLLQVIVAMLLCGRYALMQELPPTYTEVCDVPSTDSKEVLLRGLGRIVPDGFLLADFTCPISEEKNLVVPTSVFLDPKRFARQRDERTFRYHRDSIAPGLFQVRAKGHLSCKPGFAIETDEEGYPIRANGFGKTGVIPCRLDEATVYTVTYVGH